MKFLVLLSLIFSGSFSLADMHTMKQSKHVVHSIDLEMTGNTVPVDLLFVVDNSGSMAAHQQQLAENVSIISTSIDKNLDLHVGVISTDFVIDKGRLLGAPSFLTPSQVGFSQTLAQHLLIGTNGSGLESFFNPILTAASYPAVQTVNDGFIRLKAQLHIVLLTDGDEPNEKTVGASIFVSDDEFIQKLSSTKSSSNLLQIDAFLSPSTNSNCLKDADVSMPLRLEKIVGIFGGSIYNICGDMTENIHQLANSLRISAQKSVSPVADIAPIQLLGIPILSSINVSFGKQVLLLGDKGWIYDFVNNKVIISTNVEWQAQPKDTALIVSYDLE